MGDIKNKLIPNKWMCVKIGDIYNIVGGGTPSTNNPEFWNGDIPWITSADIYGLHDIRPRKMISKNGVENSTTSFVPEGSIIVVTRVGLGKLALTKKPICFSQDSQALLGNNELINPKYSLYFLSNAVEIFKYQSRGTTIPGVTKKQLSELLFPLSPINEQNRIVEKIEELFTKLDAGVAALEKIKAQLKRYRQAVLKAAFSGELTAEWRQKRSDVGVGSSRPNELKISDVHEGANTAPLQNNNMHDLPKGWEWKTINELGDIITGTTPPKSNLGYYGNDFPFYKPTDLNYGYYVRNSADGLSKEGIKKGRYLPEKSVLVTCIGATIGKTGLIRKAGSCNQQINAIVPKESILPEYVYFICTSPQFQKTIFDNASSTTLPILNKGKFGILPFPLALLEEQQQIVSEIERRFSVADEVEKTVENALKQARRLRQSILKMAFEGKLVPQDPNDEPAEKLLERIRVAKAKMTETKKMRKKK